MVDVKCPCCGAAFPYSLIAKQLNLSKRKYDRNQILKIIQNSGEITTGELLEHCHLTMKSCITLRHLNNIIKDFKKEGKVTTTRLYGGKHGATTLIKAV